MPVAKTQSETKYFHQYCNSSFSKIKQCFRNFFIDGNFRFSPDNLINHVPWPFLLLDDARTMLKTHYGNLVHVYL